MAGFNKMFIMLPVMFAARKIDGEDPNMVFLLRCSYFTVQAIIVLIVAYIYVQATAAASKEGERIVYVPPPPQPFADPNAKKKYTETKYGVHLASQARSLLGSTLFGILITTGLHMWKGMVVGLAIQTIMGPLNLAENALAKALLFGGGLSGSSEKRIFEEKDASELTADDEIVDEAGNVVARKAIGGKKGGGAIAAKGQDDEKVQSFEDILLDTWDGGAEADIAPLMSALNKKNANYKTVESGWTPVMVLSGLGAKGCPSALRQLKALGADPGIVDGEGWNALHWAAFHGSADAAKVLLDENDYDGLKMGLNTVKDKEGKTALHHARAEGNEEVAVVIEEAERVAEEKKKAAEATGKTDDGVPDPAQDEGLRKRK